MDPRIHSTYWLTDGYGKMRTTHTHTHTHTLTHHISLRSSSAGGSDISARTLWAVTSGHTRAALDPRRPLLSLLSAGTTRPPGPFQACCPCIHSHTVYREVVSHPHSHTVSREVVSHPRSHTVSREVVSHPHSHTILSCRHVTQSHNIKSSA